MDTAVSKAEQLCVCICK